MSICSIAAVYLQHICSAVLHVYWTDLQCIVINFVGPVSTAVKYVSKCSEVYTSPYWDCTALWYGQLR